MLNHKKNILTFLCFLFIGIQTHAQNTELSVLFEKDSYDLTPEAFKELKALSNQLIEKSKNHKYSITITGHTDSDGSTLYNLKLSENRINSVLEYLMENGIDTSRINANYFGESKPRVENKDEASMSLNRRVEILTIFEKKDPVKTEVPKEIVAVDPCEKDTTIFLPKGTRLKMNICDFMRNRKAIMSSYEITTMGEILRSGVSLETDKGERLITGGMIVLGNDSTQFEKPVEVTMPLIDGFYTCNDSSYINRMRLYRSNHNGDWVDQDSLLVGERAGTTTFTFTVTQGGMFNCDAIALAPVRVLAQGASILLGPIVRRIQNDRNTIRIKAPKGERLARVRIATECINCSQPYITNHRSVKYNKRRTKAKVKISCCLSDEITVSYRLSKRKGIETEELVDLRKVGFKKLANCGSAAGILASINRIFRKTPKIYRKYRLPEVST